MNLSCRDLAGLLLEYLAGELDEAGRADLEKHLEACPPCAVYLMQYRVTVSVARKLPPRPMPHELACRLQEMLRREGG